MASSFSTGQNTSSSTSSPTVIETPENSIIDQLSGVASGLAGQMTNWANNVFAHTSQITDQAVGNFFDVSQRMQGLSNNLTDQYNNVFAPQNKSLADEANSYNSVARQQVDMGQAGATQAQAGDAGVHNAEEGLRSYGIDPSSGRYAALDKAAAVQNAANIAGAMNTQRNADAATGQRLRSEAVQVGATLPAAIANVNNTGIQANTGASNATLANANTGRNLYSLPNDYLKTAMDVKLPPTGQNAQSQGQGTSNSSGSSPDPSHSGSGAGSSAAAPGASPTANSSPAWMPQHGGQPGGAGVVPPGGGDTTGPGPTNNNPLETGTGTIGPQTTSDIFGGDTGVTGGSQLGGGTYDPGGLMGGWGGSSTYMPGGGVSGGFDGEATTMTPNGSSTWDPSQNMSDAGTGGSGWTDPPPQTNSDPTVWGDSGSSSPDYSYKMGGAIPMTGANRHAYKGPRPNFMAEGGQVDPTMSPSGGQQTDDVQAQGPGGSPINLNSNEFVIPQDVALWKGQEFFQNLINDSRKKRMTAPAKPTVGPAR